MDIVLSHYICDICHPAIENYHNELDLQFQGFTENIFKECDKIKCILSINIALTKVYLIFILLPQSFGYIRLNKVPLSKKVRVIITSYLINPGKSRNEKANNSKDQVINYFPSQVVSNFLL